MEHPVTIGKQWSRSTCAHLGKGPRHVQFEKHIALQCAYIDLFLFLPWKRFCAHRPFWKTLDNIYLLGEIHGIFSLFMLEIFVLFESTFFFLKKRQGNGFIYKVRKFTNTFLINVYRGCYEMTLQNILTLGGDHHYPLSLLRSFVSESPPLPPITSHLPLAVLNPIVENKVDRYLLSTSCGLVVWLHTVLLEFSLLPLSLLPTPSA